MTQVFVSALKIIQEFYRKNMLYISDLDSDSDTAYPEISKITSVEAN